MENMYEELAELLEVDEVKDNEILSEFECWDSLTVLSIIESQDLSSAASFSIYNSENFLSIKIRCLCRTHLHALHQDLIDFFTIQFTRICLYDIAGIKELHLPVPSHM